MKTQILFILLTQIYKIRPQRQSVMPLNYTARKTIFSYSRRPEKMVFPKKSRWNMNFLVLLGKMTFVFPKNMTLHRGRKMKDDLSQKITRKYDIFFKP